MRTGDYKETVAQLVALTDSKVVWGWTFALILALVIAPFLIGAYALTLLVSALIAAIGAVGLNLLTGTTGLISLGQAGFLAVHHLFGIGISLVCCDRNQQICHQLFIGALSEFLCRG